MPRDSEKDGGELPDRSGTSEGPVARPRRATSTRRKEGDSAPREGAALAAALKLLSIRARTRHELTVLLDRRRFLPAEQAEALARVEALGYLDDDRFACDRALFLLRTGKLGPLAVMHRLLAHGLQEPQAADALRHAQSELSFDAEKAARAVLERRGLERPSTAALRAKAARLLRSRGFSPDLVEALLGNSALESGPDEG